MEELIFFVTIAGYLHEIEDGDAKYHVQQTLHAVVTKTVFSLRDIQFLAICYAAASSVSYERLTLGKSGSKRRNANACKGEGDIRYSTE